MKLTVLIDTNVMMVALSPKSNLHKIWKLLIEGKFNLVMNTEILFEYEEQISLRYSDEVVAEFSMIMNEAPNIVFHEPFFKWNLIKEDADDNKFADTSFSASADYIVTHDRHFNVLSRSAFPVIRILNAYDFLDLFKDN